MMEAEPDLFSPVPWGRRGWTNLDLGGVGGRRCATPLPAWRNVAPPGLVARHAPL